MKNETIKKMEADHVAEVHKVSKNYRRKLMRDARIFCNKYPYLADGNNYWHDMSARHLMAALVLSDMQMAD